MYEIKPYQGFNDIRFGCVSTEIEKYMKVNPRKVKKSPYDKCETDVYNDFYVYYDEHGKCEAIEFTNNAELIFNQNSLFDKKYIDIETIFRNMDSNIEIDEVGFNSNKFGIGVYAPNKDDCNSKIESVIIFKQGYYEKVF